MIKLIIVGAIIMLFVLCLIGAYREDVKLNKQIQKITQDWVNNELQVMPPAIITQPSADVVEVVRCKDCKHKGGYKDGSVKWCDRIPNADFYVDDDFFCANGERKDKV